jgi:predicted dehydrogenase
MPTTPSLISRRGFLGRSAQLATFSLVAPQVIGLRGAAPPSSRLNLAFVGVAGRGAANLGGLGSENVVALCDVDVSRGAQARQQHPQALVFQDFRKMLDAVQDGIDGVVVSTPDHTHAAVVLPAIELGKHVYCEKPLGHDLGEVRQMTEAARRKRVVTQLGNQGHSYDSIREFVELVRSGVIGNVREIHARCESNYRPREFRVRPPATPPVPAELDWDLWLGPAAYRPYHPVYHPGKWRGWLDFGGGVVGDWVCHVIDPVFWALDLGAPSRVQAEALDYDDPRVRAETYPPGCTLRYEFPARGDRPAVTLYWYDGSVRPPRPADLELQREFPGTGAVVVGEKGSIMYGSHGASGVQLIPQARMREFGKPPQSMPRSPGHHEEWVQACKRGGKAGSDFDYGGPLTEIALLGLLALRFHRQELLWDGRALQVTNLPAALPWIRPPRRAGWEI